MERQEYELMYRLEETHWWFVGKRAIAGRLLDCFLGPQDSRRILDAGCGTGRILQFLRQYGTPLGIDLAGEALQWAARRDPSVLCQASLLHLPFPAETFDLVTSFDVLYHRRVSDDRQALRELARVCKPGGYLLVTDSACKWLWSEHDVAMHARERYSLPELALKLREAGFTIARISYTNTFLFPLVFLRRHWPRRHSRSGPVRSDVGEVPAWLNRVLLLVLQVEAALIPWVRFPVGSSLACLARKGEPIFDPP